jgi:hypothetical protein
MVPVGVTVQDCGVEDAPETLAATVKLFGVRDCCAVGVQARVLPLRVAPVGPLVRANVTPVPVAAS